MTLDMCLVQTYFICTQNLGTRVGLSKRNESLMMASWHRKLVCPLSFALDGGRPYMCYQASQASHHQSYARICHPLLPPRFDSSILFGSVF